MESLNYVTVETRVFLTIGCRYNSVVKSLKIQYVAHR
jgi:hypothetical protein